MVVDLMTANFAGKNRASYSGWKEDEQRNLVVT